jgi:hypothetical protein
MFVVIRSLALAALFLRILAAQAIPVLTVCEALHELPEHNGKNVIVVGRYFYAFEGTFMNEGCDVDGRVTIKSKRWLSMIAFGPRESSERKEIEWDAEALNEKLKQVQKTTRLRSPQASPSIEGWIAVYGRLEAPQTLRPPGRSGSRFRAGNGYGAGGSVPAQLHTIAEYGFPVGSTDK